MSVVENISKWKAKSEIDYFSLFVPLWLSFNAWFRDKYEPESRDRIIVDRIKGDITSRIYSKFADYFVSDKENNSIKSRILKTHVGKLHQALMNANLQHQNSDKALNFMSILTTRDENGNALNHKYENIIKTENQKQKIKLDDNIYFTNHTETVFKAVIEVLYQVRCCLFHGDLVPNSDNSKVVKYCYLILQDLMEEI